MRARSRSRTTKARRRRAEAAGRRAEWLAAALLTLKGYRIMARRYRAPGGEIDLIAAWPPFGAPSTIAFVEVKQRADAAAFADAITPRQRQRIEAGAKRFIGTHRGFSKAKVRFDGVFVSLGIIPLHKTALWRPQD